MDFRISDTFTGYGILVPIMTLIEQRCDLSIRRLTATTTEDTEDMKL